VPVNFVAAECSVIALLHFAIKRAAKRYAMQLGKVAFKGIGLWGVCAIKTDSHFLTNFSGKEVHEISSGHHIG
jgi:hypothetical protein